MSRHTSVNIQGIHQLICDGIRKKRLHEDGVLRHPADSEVCKDFDNQYCNAPISGVIAFFFSFKILMYNSFTYQNI